MRPTPATGPVPDSADRVNRRAARAGMAPRGRHHRRRDQQRHRSCRCCLCARIVPLRALGRCGGYTLTSRTASSGIGRPAFPGTSERQPGRRHQPESRWWWQLRQVRRSRPSTRPVPTGPPWSLQPATRTPTPPASTRPTARVDHRRSNEPQCGRAYYSNFGAVVEVAAPGGDVTTGTANGVLSTLNSGSSTPGSDQLRLLPGHQQWRTRLWAGLAALLKAADPSLTPDQIDRPSPRRPVRSRSCNQCGSGIADAAAAIASLTVAAAPVAVTPSSRNGVPETGLAASTGTELRSHWRCRPVRRTCRSRFREDPGDADLYVRFGSPPTTSSYELPPVSQWHSETCDISSVQAGTYHVMVRAWSTFWVSR